MRGERLLLVSFSPVIYHALVELLFSWVVLSMPEALADETVGQILLRTEVTLIVVGILIAIAVANVLHQLGGSVAQM